MTIHTIRSEVEAAILAATPDVEPAITYRAGPYLAPLSETDAPLSPDEGTRTVQVTALPTVQLGRMSGGRAGGQQSFELVQAVEIEVRYVVGSDYDAYSRLSNLTASDAARLTKAIVHKSYSVSVAGWSVRSAQLAQLKPGGDTWIMRLELTVTYLLTG